MCCSKNCSPRIICPKTLQTVGLWFVTHNAAAYTCTSNSFHKILPTLINMYEVTYMASQKKSDALVLFLKIKLFLNVFLHPFETNLSGIFTIPLRGRITSLNIWTRATKLCYILSYYSIIIIMSSYTWIKYCLKQNCEIFKTEALSTNNLY